eukprot:973227-Amphidinium_carterae.1
MLSVCFLHHKHHTDTAEMGLFSIQLMPLTIKQPTCTRMANSSAHKTNVSQCITQKPCSTSSTIPGRLGLSRPCAWAVARSRDQEGCAASSASKKCFWQPWETRSKSTNTTTNAEKRDLHAAPHRLPPAAAYA